jgi:hypothetical protein
VASSTTALPLLLEMTAMVLLAAISFLLVRPSFLFAKKA